MTLSNTTKGKAKIYVDTPLLTDKMAKFDKPDIVIWNAMEQTEQFIDVTVPQDYNVISTTANKITKYKDLQI